MIDKAQKIREEVERRIKLHKDSLTNPIHRGFGLQKVINAKISELTYLLSFIDSMQEEPTGNPLGSTHAEFRTAVESLGISQEEHDAIVDKYLYGKEPELVDVDDLPKKEPVSEDLPHIRHRDTLDEFAYQCAYDLSNDWAKETPEWKDVKTACKLGAQWQKEQMMAKAIDAEVLENYDGKVLEYDGSILDEKLSNCKVFDKVKIVIIKKN